MPGWQITCACPARAHSSRAWAQAGAQARHRL